MLYTFGIKKDLNTNTLFQGMQLYKLNSYLLETVNLIRYKKLILQLDNYRITNHI